MVEDRVIRSLPMFLVSMLPGCGEEFAGDKPANETSMSLEDPHSLLKNIWERAIEIIQGGERFARPHDPLTFRGGKPDKESVLCKMPEEQTGRPRVQGLPLGLSGYCKITELEDGKVIRIRKIGLGRDAHIRGPRTGTMLNVERIFVGEIHCDGTGNWEADHCKEISIEASIMPASNREGYCEILRMNDFNPYAVSREPPEFREPPEKTLRKCYHWEQSTTAYVYEIIGYGQEKPLEHCMVCEEELCTSTRATDIEVCKTTNPPEYFR